MATFKHIPRWILASVSKHFDARRESLDMFIEGQHRDTQDKKNFIELRVDGPYFTELSKGYWRIYSEINVLVQSAMDDQNFHTIWTNIGIVAAAFTSIPVYKYGNGPDDDGSLFGCMNLISEARGKERIQVSYFGKIAPSAELQQATVEGHYEMRSTISD